MIEAFFGARESHEVDKEAVLTACEFQKMFSLPIWQEFEKKVEEIASGYAQLPEVYAANPSQALIDVGARQAFDQIKKFILHQKEIIKNYAEEQ